MPRKRGNNITKVSGGAALVAPDFMREDDVAGTELLGQYVVPARLKVVQKQSDNELLDAFDVGTLIVTPGNVPVCTPDVGFLFTPLFFFVEYCTWNPIALKGQAPAIRERSFDPKSVIAMKARDPEKRLEPLEGNKKLYMRHVEHLNFLVTIHDKPQVPESVIMSFSRGGHGQGRQFSSLIQMRKAPLFGCVFRADIKAFSNEMGDWFGISPSNPSEEDGPAWVQDKEQYESLRAAHEMFKKVYSDARLRVDYDGDDATYEQTTDDGEM